jgi:hypothetical protein
VEEIPTPVRRLWMSAYEAETRNLVRHEPGQKPLTISATSVSLGKPPRMPVNYLVPGQGTGAISDPGLLK